MAPRRSLEAAAATTNSTAPFSRPQRRTPVAMSCPRSETWLLISPVVVETAFITTVAGSTRRISRRRIRFCHSGNYTNGSGEENEKYASFWCRSGFDCLAGTYVRGLRTKRFEKKHATGEALQANIEAAQGVD